MESEVFYPQSLEELLQILDTTKSTIYAGGTDLMVERRKGRKRNAEIALPIIHIKDIKQLNKIEIANEYVEIGACCSYSKLLLDKNVPKILKDAILTIGGPAVRNFGTIGGNICNASPAADCIPVLAVLNSELTIQSKNNQRIVKLVDFILGRKKVDLKEGEVLVSIRFAAKYLTNLLFQKFEKVGLRNSMTLSKVSVAIILTDDKKIHLAFGSIAPKVIRVEENEFKISRKKIGFKDFAKLYKPYFNAIDDARSTKEYRENTALLLGYNLYLEAFKLLKS